MSHLVTDAVKEAFIEVDEEAPGGWQGWRMWNEMVTDHSGSASYPSSKFDDMEHGPPGMTWDSCHGSGAYGIDPIQDATMYMSNGSMTYHDQWNLAGYR